MSCPHFFEQIMIKFKEKYSFQKLRYIFMTNFVISSFSIYVVTSLSSSNYDVTIVVIKLLNSFRDESARYGSKGTE